MTINNYEEYKEVMGLNTVDVGSRLALIREIQKIQRERGKSEKGFNKMPKTQLKAIYNTLFKMPRITQ